MSNDILDMLSSTINIERDPYLNNLKDLMKILCRVFIKNLDIFVSLYYYQYKFIFSKANKMAFYNSDAGDIYQSFRMKFSETHNTTANTILKDVDFAKITMCFAEQIKNFSNLSTFADRYENNVEKMWEVCKCLIIPVRLNPMTIPPTERERILRLWLSIAFVLPFIDAYNEKFLGYSKSISALRGFKKALVEGTESEKPVFTEKMQPIMELQNSFIDFFVSPGKVGESKMDMIIRTYMFMLLKASKDIIQKPCPNLKKCKAINADYQGDCLHMLDDYVTSQLRIIDDTVKILTPRS